MTYKSLIDSIFLHPRPWVLSGAGISTESGIADFRGPGGLWERIDPMEYFSIDALHKNPAGFYSLGIEMFDFMDQALPNAAHEVLGELQRKRLIGPIVTQNIDSLHQKGGADYVYEVHGHVRTATCMNCRKTVITLGELSNRIKNGEMPPRCRCGGLLKPDVILFGDTMPVDYQDALAMQKVFNRFKQSIIVVGSTLSVTPIGYFPLEFSEMIIVNSGSTAMDSRAAFRFDGKAGEIMTGLKAQLVEWNGDQEIIRLPAGFLPGVIIASLGGLARRIEKAHGHELKSLQTLAQADSILVSKMLASYPKRSTRQAIEEYWLNEVGLAVSELSQQCGAGIGSTVFNAIGQSPLLSSLSDYTLSACRVVEKYRRQQRYLPEVLSELALQALGVSRTAVICR